MKRLALLLLFGAAACGEEAPPGQAPAAGSRPAAAAFVAPPAAIELGRGGQPRELVGIGIRGVAIGAAEGPLAWKFFADPRRAEEAWYLLQTYAPFRMAVPAGELVFRGRGRVKPGAAERRRILEWARRVAAEAAGGRAGAAYGLLFAWHQGGAPGICEDLAVYLTGEAVATACGWDGEVRGWLEPGQLDRIYGWFDRLQPFQAGGDPRASLEPGVLQTRLIVAGRGPRPATPSERAEVQAFAAALFAELAARRRGAPALASDVAEPAAGARPPQRLLLPPAALSPRPARIVLQLPERPPPPPRPAPRSPLQEAPQSLPDRAGRS